MLNFQIVDLCLELWQLLIQLSHAHLNRIIKFFQPIIGNSLGYFKARTPMYCAFELKTEKDNKKSNVYFILYGLNAKEGADDGGHDDQENTGTKPGSGDFAGIGITGIPFGIDFHRANQAEDGADGIHEIGTGLEITADLGIGLVDTGVTVLCKEPEGKADQ
jgi:hypothetical protein